MKLVSTIRTCLVTGAVLGLLLPQVSFAESMARPAVRDAALQAGGMLQGVLVSPNGENQASSRVQLLSRGEVVARTRTDHEGRFQFRGLRAGVYGVQADGVATGFRVWAEGAAPPSAVSEVLLVGGQTPVVRGALQDFVSKPLLLGGLLAAAGVIGGVIGYNIKDDAS